MKKLLALLLIGTAFATPSLAYARDITLTGQMQDYYGPEAYIAVYLTKADGTYDSTLYVAGRKTRYYRDLTGWARYAASDSNLNLNGITGASIGAGTDFTIDISLSDALIDAGYVLHVDSAVEHQGSVPDDVVVPLSSDQSGVAHNGEAFVKTLTVNM